MQAGFTEFLAQKLEIDSAEGQSPARSEAKSRVSGDSPGFPDYPLDIGVF
jgi:hypothetical protein